MGKLQTFWKATIKFVDKNLPTILTGLALGGLAASVGSAIKETPKAQEALTKAKLDKAEEIEREADDEEAMDIYRNEDGELDLKKVKLTVWEQAKILAPIYWPCALTTVATGTCIVMSNRVSMRRYAALAAALSLNEKRLVEYQGKVKEIFGEKKEQQVQKEIAKDHALNCPENIQEQYSVGQVYPCYLEMAGLYFVSSRQAVESAFNRWNHKAMRNGGDAVLDDLIYELGIDVKDCWLYSHTDWDVNNGKLVEPVIDGGETMTGVPCLNIRMNRSPDNT